MGSQFDNRFRGPKVLPLPIDGENLANSTSARLRRAGLVEDTLAQTPQGRQLARYFGIDNGSPQQSAPEAERAERLVQRLAEPTSLADLTLTLREVADHNHKSGSDPAALRAIMKGNRNPLLVH